MTRFVYLVLVLVGLLPSLAAGAEAKAAGPLRTLLPPVAYAVPGVETNLYWDNAVLTPNPEQYKFRVQCDLGRAEARRWTMVPAAADVGDHRLALTVSDSTGRPVGQASTLLRVVPATAGQGRKLRLLVIGDSLTGATAYPNEIARLLSLPGNPGWEMLGTHRPPSAAAGVSHEGYGGWTWDRFNSYFNPDPKAPPKSRSSPFVFVGADGKPTLDLSRYFTERCAGRRPDLVTIMLGINDCFHAKADDPKAIDARIGDMFKQAEILLAALRRAAPAADLGVCLTTPPNARESGFEANYHGKYHRWGWKQIQHRLVERQIAQFGNREKEHVFLVPTELNLDPVDGYPVNNGVHPNLEGYKQIGASIYAWLKWRLQ